MFCVSYLSLSVLYHVANMQLYDGLPYQYVTILKIEKYKRHLSNTILGNRSMEYRCRGCPVVDHSGDMYATSNYINLSHQSKDFTISGRIADNISEMDKQSNNRILLKRRNMLIEQFITKNCKYSTRKEFCNTPNRLNKILKSKEDQNLKALFDSKKYMNNGTTCEGCQKNMNMRFLNKTSNSGILIRKFIGNTEDNIIYNPNNRNIRNDLTHRVLCSSE